MTGGQVPGGHVRAGRVGLVAGREIRARLATKAYRVTTVILVVVALAGVLVPHLVGHGTPSYDIAVVGRTPAGTADALRSGGRLIDATIRVQMLADEAAAETGVRADKVDVALIDGERLLTRGEPRPQLRFLVSQVVAQARAQERLAAAGIGAAEAAALLDIRPLPVRQLEPPSAARQANKSLAFAGLLLVYLALLTYGSLVSAGVVEEKTSRVSEVLLGAVRPYQLMAGKVLGIGVAAVLQLLAIGIPTGIAALSIGSLHVPRGTPLTFAAVLLWFVLGYALYSCAFAAAGASASRPEEAGVVAGPMNVVIIASYFVGVRVLSTPDDTFSRVVSFIPPLTPMAMLPRAAAGHVAAWEVPLAVALVVASTWLLVHLAGRIYAGAIVQSGPRVKLRDAWRQAGRTAAPREERLTDDDQRASSST